VGGVSLFLDIILYLLLALAVILILVLAFPFELRVRAQPDLTIADDWEISGPLPWQAAIRWGWGMVSVRLHGDRTTLARPAVAVAGVRFGINAKRKTGKEPTSKDAAPTWRRARKRLRIDLALFISLIHEGRLLIRRLWRMLGIRITGDLTFGFPDPSVTGMTLGLFQSGVKPSGVRLAPEFFDPCVRGKVQVTARFIGLVALGAAIAFALSAPVRRLWIPKIRFGALHLKVGN